MSGPLTGVRVVEMAGLAPVPFGVLILADLGADVVRVERAGGGGIAPPPGPIDRGRRTVKVDLKNPDGVATVRQLATAADVFVEGWRPGVAEKLGVGPADLAEINPRLIYGRLTGFGQDGPLAARAGHDINYIAISGALGLIGRQGENPYAPANFLADFAGGGAFLALGVLAALYERDRSGQGQVIDAAMIDGSALLSIFMHGMHTTQTWNDDHGTNMLDGAGGFYDTFETADGKYMAVGAVEPQFFTALVGVLEIDATEHPFYLDPRGWPEWKQVLGAKFKAKTRDEWEALFDGVDACVTPVLSPWEAHQHPHNVARAAFSPDGSGQQPNPAPRFSRTTLPLPPPNARAAAHEILASWA